MQLQIRILGPLQKCLKMANKLKQKEVLCGLGAGKVL